jgi:hypothetical protein
MVLLPTTLTRQLLLALADYLCSAYLAQDESIVKLINNVSIVIIPTMNPDGFDHKLRENRFVCPNYRAYNDFSKLACRSFDKPVIGLPV